MKTIGITAMLTALVFASCSKPATEETPAPAAPAAPPAASTPAPATPAGLPPAATPAPPPSAAAATPAPELAPEGVFYLIAAARVETSTGVVGLPPGTGVRLISPGVYQTPAGDVPLDAALLTNDMGAARRARDAERAKQAAVQPKTVVPTAADKARMAASNDAAAAAQKKAINQIERQRLEARVANLRGQEENLNAQLRVLNQKRSKESYNEYYKGRIVTSTTVSQIKTTQDTLAGVQNQINATITELNNLD